MLLEELFAEPLLQGFEPATPAIRHEQDPPGERQAATLQIPEQRLADLVMLRRAVPKSQGHLLATHVHAQRDESRLAAPVDCVEEYRERLEVG